MVCISLAASLPVTSTDHVSLPNLSSSHTEAAIAAPPLTGHSSHFPHRSHSHTQSLSYDHILSIANSPTHTLFNPLATEPPTGLTSPHDLPGSHLPSSQAHQSLIVAIFGSIGGTVALLFLVLCARCAVIHSRIPRHNTALTVTGRAQLVREIAEYAEYASRRQRHSLTVPPPPPYEHAPSYDSLMPHRSS